ncbi:MAG TPA: helix-turn-helix domain-containing protein [Epulopiscium sp.]|nr:helix-turn-helix domain-containing protein [Candidatus Epulonipiscium sp.]
MVKCYISITMKKYKQLNREQRYQIGVLLKIGKNKSEIASIIGVHRSTISRELKRNEGTPGRHACTYVPRLAQNKAEKRHKTCFVITAIRKTKSRFRLW